MKDQSQFQTSESDKSLLINQGQQPQSSKQEKTLLNQESSASEENAQMQESPGKVSPFKNLDEAMEYIEKQVKTMTGIQITPEDEIHKILFVIALTFHDMNQAVVAAGMNWEKKKKKKLW